MPNRIEENLPSVRPVDPERWVDDYGDFLYRFALVRVRLSQVAEDLVQETFLAALRNYHSFSGQSSERTWLCGILKNKVFDYYRKLGRETTCVDVEFLPDECGEKFIDGGWIHSDAPKHWKPEADEIVHRSEFWETIRSCLAKLPDRVARVFILREMDELPTEEICASLKITHNNLWVMLHRSRMALRECVEKNWFLKVKK